jgi:hypothetical protein
MALKKMITDIKIFPIKTDSHLQFVFEWEDANVRLYLKYNRHKEIVLMDLYFSSKRYQGDNLFSIIKARSFWNELIKYGFKRWPS